MVTSYKLGREYLAFTSSLPYLKRGGTPRISSEDFLRQASTVLESADYLFLAELSFDSCFALPSIDEPLAEYFRWELALRNRIASHRHSHPLPMADQQGGHAEEFTLVSGGVGFGLDILLQDCLAVHPLQAEQQMVDARWERLEFTKGARQSDLVFLSVYRLQLLLLERTQRWEPSSGEQRYYDTCQAILQRSKGSFA